MRALVTGVAGFVGSHLAERLLRDGWEVAGMDNFDPYYDPAIKRRNLAAIRNVGGIDFMEGDIRNPADVAKALVPRPDVVFHLAARAGVRASLQEPGTYYAVNVLGTVQLLEASLQAGVGRFVFASSSSVYGDAPLPMREDGPCRPLSFYGASKLAAEQAVRLFDREKGLETVSLRYFTVFGERQRPDEAIMKFASLLRDGKPLPVYGDGTQQRDFTHVSDIVNGTVRAAGCKGHGFAVNLGSGKVVTVNDLVRMLGEVSGRQVRTIAQEKQQGDAPHTHADIRQARELLEWKPVVSLRAGLERFWVWQQATSR